ncbi:DUF4288 domain-containing protein [Chryseolinea sp. T2]|uniref:DUF4288 domain-containing protein n=1 Tax=Chryseolinea sp. T2 TaxID=3129255 RepID=UPI0030780618
MNWYITKVIFAIKQEGNESTSQFDEQLRLISAEDQEEAFLKARALGLSEEDCFYNEKKKQVRWEFINVSEVTPLTALEDGVELHSRIHETDAGSNYIHFVHMKAIGIRLATFVPN